jgi:UDP-2-acetamido-2,6-beta-L-arabino-hexul-4-ose reductase
MNILIIGSTGFIGQNLVSFLSRSNQVEVAKIGEEEMLLFSKIQKADVIVNASGVSRSKSENDFFLYNIYYSQRLFNLINTCEGKMYLYFSSIHYNSESLYGISKRYNEFLMSELDSKNSNYLLCLRIPGIFGPGIKPNYVSVVATFCYNLANRKVSKIVEGDKIIDLLFIEDLIININKFILYKKEKGFEIIDYFPETVSIKVNNLFDLIKKISLNRINSNLKNNFIEKLLITYNYYKK